MNNNKYLSRRFMLVVGLSIVACYALLSGIMSGGEWVSAITVLLGAFKISNFMEKKNDLPV